MKTFPVRFKVLFSSFLILLLAANSIVTAQDGRGAGNVSKQARTGEKRIALVIGNAAYGDNVGKLTNPVNDAADVAATLKSLGFELVGGKANLNVNLREIDELVRDFGRQIKNGGVGVFYFAGHGIQANRVNYLLPLNAKIEKQNDLRFEAFSVDRVTSEMEDAGNRLNIVILDACRNNPLTRSVRSTEKGLASPSSIPTGTYIAFAAKDGQTASENEGKRNGLYTQELLKNLKTPDLRLEDIFINTRREVKKLSDDKQVPEEYGSVDDVFYFKTTTTANNSGAAKPVPSPNIIAEPNFGLLTEAAEIERGAFVSIQNSTDIADIRAVLEEYPSSKYAAAARLKLDKLMWESIKNSRDKTKIQNYLDEFKTGQFASLARIELRKLNTVAVAPPITNAPSGTLQAGETSVSKLPNGAEMSFAYIPAGEFEMGSSEAQIDEALRICGKGCERRSFSDEAPKHRVRISKGFWMGQTEVTQGQWQAVVGSLPSECQYGDFKGKFVGANKPIICINWDEANEFIGKLNARNDGYTYRLPTEAEWEYAARAGTSGDYAGNLKAVAWYSKGSSQPVKMKLANGWNLYDMLGNVSEWTADWLGDYGASDVSDPVGVSSGSFRVDRGGSWYHQTASILRWTDRSGEEPSNRTHYLGFRVVKIKL